LTVGVVTSDCRYLKFSLFKNPFVRYWFNGSVEKSVVVIIFGLELLEVDMKLSIAFECQEFAVAYLIL
jgi:hypothetical protein